MRQSFHKLLIESKIALCHSISKEWRENSLITDVPFFWCVPTMVLGGAKAVAPVIARQLRRELVSFMV